MQVHSADIIDGRQLFEFVGIVRFFEGFRERIHRRDDRLVSGFDV